ncbi:MAG: Ig-like domain-containing protein, partial [Anaerolineales bacterium]
MTQNYKFRSAGTARLTTKVHLLPLYLLVGLVLACSLPGRGEPTTSVSTELPEVTKSPTPPPQPTPTPQPLPPAVVESDPPPGPGFPLQGPLTLYFNQQMDRPSVENALSGQPSLAGRFEWLDDTTVVFKPDAALLPDTDVSVSINTSARAANGLTLPEPLRLDFRTVAPLQIVQTLPEPDQNEVNPSSALVVTFNQPVVPLGEAITSSPEAFHLEPPADGRGEWVNTSTYIFYPEPPLAGGVSYRVQLNSDLRSTAGAPLLFDADASVLSEPQWSFTTAQPRLEAVNLDQIQGNVPLDISVEMNFNQPMEARSAEENFSLLGPSTQRVPGQFGWNADFTTLTFTPTQLLERGVDYTLILQGSAQAQGGTALGQDFSTQFRTIPELSILRTEPGQGLGTPIYRGVVIYFSGPIESDEVLNYVTLEPSVTNLRHWWDGDRRALYINGDFTPVTDYNLRLSSQLSDPWDDTLGSEFRLDFRTNPLDPELIMAHGGIDLFLTPQETSLTLQATNLSSANISVGSVPFADYVRFLTPGGFDMLRGYLPADERTWNLPLNLPGDRVYPVDFPITPEGGPLSPGIYRLEVN